MTADAFDEMRQQHEQLRQEVWRLTNRCCALENDIKSHVDARMMSDSRVAQLEQGHREHEAKIVQLKTLLHEECLGTDAMSRAARPVLCPASEPLRTAPVVGDRTDLAVGDELGRIASVRPSKPSEPSPVRVLSLGGYPREIPEKEREAIRTRMLTDRGPDPPTPPTLPQEVEAPSRDPRDVSQPTHNDGETRSLKSVSRVMSSAVVL